MFTAMVTQWFVSGLAIASAVALSPRIAAADDTDVSPVPGFVRADRRLGARVSVSEPRIAVGDLLKALSAQTGVRLEAGRRDGAADRLVTIFVRDQPVWQVMDAVWSLFGYHDATWSWTRTGSDGLFNYWLTRSAAAQRLGADLRAWTEQAFARSVEEMTAVAVMSPEDRVASARRVQQALMLDDAEFAVYRPTFLSADAPWAGLKLFATILSPLEQAAVVRGDSGRSVELTAMRDADYALLREIAPGVQRPTFLEPAVDGNAYRSLRFVRMGVPGAAVPGIGITLVRARGSTSTQQVFPSTGLNRSYRAMLRARWQLPGDANSDDRERAAVDSVAANAVGITPAPSRRALWERCVARLAAGANIGVIARVPSDSIARPPDPGGGPVGSFLDNLDDRNAPPGMMHKWRAGLLVLSSLDWPQHEDAEAALEVLQELRNAAKRHGGMLSLDDIVTAAGEMSDSQFAGAGREFPILPQLATYHGLLALCPPSLPNAASSRDAVVLPLNDGARSAAGDFMTAEIAHYAPQRPSAIQFRQTDAQKDGGPARTIFVEILGPGGNAIIGFAYDERPAAP